MFKKQSFGFALFFMFSYLLQAQAADNTLNLYIWYEQIPDSVLRQFEMETGIKIKVDFYDSNEMLETKLLAGQTGYDLVMPTAYPYLARQIKGKIFLPLSTHRLKNYKLIDPVILEKLESADPENRFAVPYAIGLNGIGYNAEKLDPLLPDIPKDTWGLFFNPEIISKFASCGVSLLEEPSEVLGPAYLYLGLDPTSESPKDLEKVTELLLKIRPYIRRFAANRNDYDLLEGEICATQYYLGSLIATRDRLQMNAQKERFKFVIPKEGTTLWIDCFAILADAPHPEAAHRFIDFMLRPDIAAQVTNFAYFATTIKASYPLVGDHLRGNRLIFPDSETLERALLGKMKSHFFRRLENRALTKIRTSH